MANLQPFRGLRYDLGHVGSLAEVVAPPYDVIDQDLQDQLYKQHPTNVVRLILNRDEPGDEPDARYQRAAKFLRNWRRQGVLTEETQPAIYVYHQTFQAGGETFTRRGFVARLHLEKFGEGSVYPHEETHSAAKADRLKLIRACKTNLSQIFGIFPDEANAAQETLEPLVVDSIPLEATDHLGVIHRVWPVTDRHAISQLPQIMGSKPIYIADGHHRYETACNYRDELAEAGELPEHHPANYVLMMFVSMHDPGMVVLPTHRLFRGVPPLTATELTEKLAPYFDCETFGSGAAVTEELWQEIDIEGEQGTLGLHTATDDTWTRVRLNESGRARMREMASDQCETWRELGVSLLHRLIIQDALGLTDLPSPKYVHEVAEVIEGLEQGDAVGRDATGQTGVGGRFELTALVMPASAERCPKRSAQAGERMPAKEHLLLPQAAQRPRVQSARVTFRLQASHDLVTSNPLCVSRET